MSVRLSVGFAWDTVHDAYSKRLCLQNIVPGLVNQKSVMLRQGLFGMTMHVRDPSIDLSLAQAQPAQTLCSVEVHSFCVKHRYDLTFRRCQVVTRLHQGTPAEFILQSHEPQSVQ